MSDGKLECQGVGIGHGKVADGVLTNVDGGATMNRCTTDQQRDLLTVRFHRLGGSACDYGVGQVALPDLLLQGAGGWIAGVADEDDLSRGAQE